MIDQYPPSELDAQSTTVRIQGPKDPVPTTRPELFSIAEPHCPAFLCWAPAAAAHAAVDICGVGAVLAVFSSGCRQGGLRKRCAHAGQ